MTVMVGWACHLKRVPLIVAVAAGLLFLDGQLGPISFSLRRVISSAILAIVILAVFRPWGRLASTLVLCIAVAFVAVSPMLSLALLGYVLAVAIVAENDTSGMSRLAPGLSQTCFSYIGISFLFHLLPQSRLLAHALSAAAYGYVRVTTGTVHHLSPTALGGPAILFLMLYLLWRWRLSGSWVRLLGVIFVPAAWFLLLPLVIPPAAAGPVPIFTRGASYGVFWVACAAFIDAMASGTEAGQYSSFRAYRRPRSFMIGAAVASLLIGATLVGVVAPGVPAKRSVLVHNRGGLDWDRPIFGKFGAFSGGMFGLFPVYARANGYRFEVLDQDSIKPEDLLGFQSLVLINSPKEWKGKELQTVRDFVARGGGLLILGDHTDVFGLMKGFNSLLDGFGIHFQFDSAYHARSTWRGCLSTAPDAVASSWDTELPSVAIGASLKLRGWARPLLYGRYAHSDLGSRMNVIGSFLGNYTYDQSEELGDMVLVASATYGRGRVIVLGDTSPFQGGLGHSFPRTVGPLLGLLSRPTNVLERPLMRTIVAALFLAILLISWIRRLDGRAIATIVAVLFLSVAGALGASRYQLQSRISINSDCFLIDKSHLPAVGHYGARVNPSWTLDTNLLRSGLRVAELDKWDRAALAKAKGVAFIAPQRAFTRGEVEDLLRFEEAGGVSLIAVGYPDASASRTLLRTHGLDLVARPLGSVPRVPANVAGRRREQERPHFLDAWPIISTSGRDLAAIPEVDVLYRAEDDVIALFCKRGRGGLLLFSDSRFFSTMNVEDMSGFWVGNLALIHDVFRKYLGVDPDSVRPAFRSPKKPG